MLALTNTTKERAWTSCRGLIAYIVESYHEPLRAALPRLEMLIDQVCREHRLPMCVLDWLQREFSVLADSLRAHLIQQDGHLFPMISHVCRSVEEAGWPCHLDNVVEELMDEATRDGEEAVCCIRRAEEYLGGTDAKEPPVMRLLIAFRELGENLEEHLHLEANVLFPAVREFLHGNNPAMERLLEEASMSHKRQSWGGRYGVPTSPEWLDEVMEETGIRDPARACRAAKSVLHALRDRLSVNKAIALGMQLPKPARVLYYEDWPHRWDRGRHAPKEDFLGEIAKSLKEEPNTDSESTAQTVFRVLAKQMAADEIEGVRNALPGEIRCLWPSQDPIRTTAELIVADQEAG
jgi:uncharacterized protein (DUF2267 family)/iron-sulfur cluster repair protein YtfE (RIC family)